MGSQADQLKNEIVEAILRIHDSEFIHYDLFFHQAAYYINVGKWYWPRYFYASLNCFLGWDFQIDDVRIVDERLEEKFERIWASHLDKLRSQRELEGAVKLKTILQSIKVSHDN